MKTGCLQGLGSGPVCLPHFSHQGGISVVNSYPMIVPNVLEVKQNYIRCFYSSDTLPRMSSLRLWARDNLNEEEEDKDDEEEPNFDESECCIGVVLLFLWEYYIGINMQFRFLGGEDGEVWKWECSITLWSC